VKFIATTLVSSSMLVQLIANYCVMFGRYRSFIGTNALLCCDRYNWSLSELISNPEHIKYFSFKCWHFNGLSDIQKSTAGSLSDLIAIRDGQSLVHFLRCLFTYYLCWIYILEVRINIIIIIIPKSKQ